MLATCAGSATAHIVVGTKTVRELVAGADLVVRARIVANTDVAGRSDGATGLDRPSVEAEVLEVIQGSFEAPRVRFVQHGHGVAHFEPGREHLLFLTAIRRSRELGTLASSDAYRWVSLQEHDDAHAIEPATRAALLGATRAYVAAARAGDADERSMRLREGTRLLLTSGDTQLAASAIRDLVVAPDAALVTREDATLLAKVIDDPGAPIGVRLGLLVQLERRGLLDGGDRWLVLMADDARTGDLVPVLRAAGPDPRPRIRARVIALIGNERELVAAAAADAAGRPGDDMSVPPLVAALAHPSARVRQAAIRGLGRVSTAQAIAALDEAGAAHPDATTRRLAAAEARKRRSQSSRSRVDGAPHS